MKQKGMTSNEKKTIILCALALFILGGCQMGKSQNPSEMDPKDLPEGRAFEDEFTRSCIQSTEEGSPGYYCLLAKNGKWKSAIPKERLTNDLDYTSKDNFESFIFTVWEEGKDTSAMVDVKFYSFYKPGEVDAKKNSLRSNIDLPLTFEETSGDNQTYYLAPFEKTLDSETLNEKYGIAAYIQKENEAGGIYVIYSIYCEANCEDTKKEELKEAYDWMLTIKFSDDEGAT